MLLAALQKVDKYYGEQTVLHNANLELRSGGRLALIGRNGSGKSTILNLLAGTVEVDGGSVLLRDGVTVAKLEQDPNFAAESILDICEQAFKDLDKLEKQLQELEHAGLHQGDLYERWEKLHEVFERRGGYERRNRRDAVLSALGFKGRQQQAAASLSGGEKTRLGLALLLMAQPDILLLDEPTNHLDMEMRGWLETYLGRYPGGIILVSHDREFLDLACDQTAEIALGILRTFDGNPSSYRAYREEQLRIEELTRKNQQRERDRVESAALQMKQWAGQNAKLHRRAKSMFKRVERLETQMIGDAEAVQATTRFRFDCEASGDIVLQAQHLSKRFKDTRLFQNIDFSIRQGERIALIGPNGAGKSTFLKVLLGELPSDDPAALLRYGSRVRLGYYDQELRGVNADLTLSQELIRLVGDVEAHNLLGRFMFPYEAQFKLIRDLSGGERARLALLKLTLARYNFLVLDEPTNHLDVEMIEALEQALRHYQGTLLIVSHDRRFIQETTDIIWELRDSKLRQYEGNWDYYQFKKNQETQKAEDDKPQAAAVSRKRSGPSKWQLERQLESLETKIQTLEKQLEAVTQQLSDTQTLSAEAITQLANEHQQLETSLLNTMQHWEECSNLLEHLIQSPIN